ncbi:MAG TPA: di-heme oxidoredictase family protein [Candidatus Eisenbacteria bacterium]|nr:di-heme oxidoredictase family protein [Candidatus Eisenbacteria bacterium]
MAYLHDIGRVCSDRATSGAMRGGNRVSRSARSRARSGRVWALVVFVAGFLSAGCDKMLTERPDPGTRFDQPIEGLGNGELGRFQAGQTQFRRGFSIEEGLGPVFNNRSCASCHSSDGRGVLENSLVRFSRAGDPAVAEGGPQLQDKAVPGADPETLPAGVEVSRRLPPPVFGVGLMEAITDSSILAHSDPGDSNADGISGRPNYVVAESYVPATEPGAGPAAKIGRFSRKAQVPALLQQVVEAYHQDMGITSSFRSTDNVNPLSTKPNPDHAPDPEVGGGELDDVMNYIRMLAPPSPGEWTDRRRQGEALFTSARCGSCHVPVMRTGMHEIEALSNRDVYIYSDLLLHDMGDGLADNRPDGQADGREWRTAPLWGMRLVREFLGGDMLLMHDGRARSVEAAIGLHGGEGAGARDAFAAMTADEKAALVDFVESR